MPHRPLPPSALVRPLEPFIRHASALPDAVARARGALGKCAHAHTLSAIALAFVLALLLVGGVGCGPTEAGSDGKVELAELFTAYEPVSPTATSDKQDAAFHRRQEVLERLRHGSQALGRAALEEFHADPKRAPELRHALLDIAAHCAPDETTPLLEQLFREFGPPIDLRTNATLLLGECAPEHAMELFPPILRDPKLPRTYPDRERVLEAYLLAAKKTGAQADELLAELATALFQAPSVRYLAVEALAKYPTQHSLSALEEVLVESGSDGLLRRKAAQAIRDGFPRDVGCATLERVADRESNVEFLQFLANMLEQHCFDH